MVTVDYVQLAIPALSIIMAVPAALAEKHFVKRNTAVSNGVLLIVNGLLTVFLANNSILLIVVGVIAAGCGILAALLTVQRDDLGTFIGSSLMTLILLIVIFVLEANVNGIVNLF